MTATLEIPVYRDHTTAPVTITNRERLWVPWVAGTWPLLDELHTKFGTGFNENDDWVGFKEGDPRRVIEAVNSDSLFIAVHEGKVGILTEVELDIAPGDVREVRINGTRDLPEKDFLKAIDVWKNRLETVGAQTAFPHSQVFLASHAATYDARLCLCAFTPLSGQEDMSFSSPYAAASEIEALDTLLYNLAYGVQAQNEDASEAGSPTP